LFCTHQNLPIKAGNAIEKLNVLYFLPRKWGVVTINSVSFPKLQMRVEFFFTKAIYCKRINTLAVLSMWGPDEVLIRAPVCLFGTHFW
jgi:hypothetical protein